jgi:cytochrome b6-f complex subunit 7
LAWWGGSILWMSREYGLTFTVKFLKQYHLIIKIKLEKIMGEMVNAMVLSMVLIPVGIAFGFFLLKLQGEEQEEA